MTAISVKRLFVGACPVFLPDRPPESFTHQGLNSFSQCGIGAYIAREDQLMGVPDNYDILFLQGGGSTQFAMIPLNLMTNTGKADFVIDQRVDGEVR